jgi:regulator of sigma E protease
MDITELLQKIITAPFEFVRDYGGPFILVLSILIFVHEWGHYIVARLCGVRVDKFSIGFGKELFGRNDKNGTRWKLCMVPLGGYVQMFGDTDPASAHHAEGLKEGEKCRPFTEEEKKVAFYAQPISRRAAIVFAGPAINYIFAILILAGLYMFNGEPYQAPIAAAIVEGMPAEAAGIKPDDKIIAINGSKIERYDEIRQHTAIAIEQELEFTVLRSIEKGKWSDKPVTIKVTPRQVVETDRFGFKHVLGRIGVIGPTGQFETIEHTPATAAAAAVRTTYRITADTLKALGQMIMGTRSTEELGGILRIGAYAGDFAQQGMVAFITFTALLSVNLGLINILPIPLLDGGHLMMYAMEKLRGKPLHERIQEYALRVGMVFLLGIMFLATWNDLVQLKVVDYVTSLFG